MHKLFLALLLATQSICALADGQADCSAVSGDYMTGTVVSRPTFARATQTLQGVQLSHTHVKVQSDQDGQYYDVAMDNVYASDYVLNARSLPRSLAAIQVGDALELCGKFYTSGYGIHWVHDNCGVNPDASHPDGWVKQIDSNGNTGDNLESSEAYCYLWN